MAQKKIDFFGQFRPTGVDPTVGAKAAALAGLGEQIGDIVFEETKKQRIKQGRKEGLESVKRDEEGKIIAPEKRGSFTFRDQAYNEAMILAHRAEVRRDTKTTLNELQNTHELDPEAFRQEAEAYRQGVTEGMPDELRFVIDEDISNDITQRGTELDDKFFAFQKEKALADIVEMAEDLQDEELNARRAGDFERAERAKAERLAIMGRGVNSGLVDPSQAKKAAEEMQEKALIHTEIGRLEGIFADDSLGIEEKIHQGTMIVDAKQNAVYKDLDPNQRDALNDALQSELNQQIRLQAEFAAQEQKEIAQETVELKLAAKHGTRSPTEIQSKAYDMFQNQQISETEYQSIIDATAHREAELTQNALTLDRVSRRLGGDESIDLTNKERDMYYENVVLERISELSPNERAAYVTNYVELTGGVPTRLKSQIRNNLRSGDQDLILEAADTIDRLDELRGIESPVTPHDRAFASLVVDLSQSMEPEEALKMARELSDPSNEAFIEGRKRMLKDNEAFKLLGFKGDYQDEVIDTMKEGIFGQQGLDEKNVHSMTSEYKTLFEAHFLSGMPEEKAREKASQILKKNWSYSNSIGRVMKHPPENYYAVQGSGDYIKTQLEDFIRESTSFGLTDPDYQQVALVSDESTERRASSRNPDYLVYVIDKNGQFHRVEGTDPSDGKIKAMRWYPDVKAERERRAKRTAEQIAKERLEKARENNILNRRLERYSPSRGF